MRIFFAGKADSMESKMVKESSKWIVRLGEARGEVECSMLAMRNLCAMWQLPGRKGNLNLLSFLLLSHNYGSWRGGWETRARQEYRCQDVFVIQLMGWACQLCHSTSETITKNIFDFSLNTKTSEFQRFWNRYYLMWRHSDILPTSELSANLFVCTNLSSCFPSSTLNSIYQFPTNFTKTSRQHVID